CRTRLVQRHFLPVAQSRMDDEIEARAARLGGRTISISRAEQRDDAPAAWSVLHFQLPDCRIDLQPAHQVADPFTGTGIDRGRKRELQLTVGLCEISWP